MIFETKHKKTCIQNKVNQLREVSLHGPLSDSMFAFLHGLNNEYPNVNSLTIHDIQTQSSLGTKNCCSLELFDLLKQFPSITMLKLSGICSSQPGGHDDWDTEMATIINVLGGYWRKLKKLMLYDTDVDGWTSAIMSGILEKCADSIEYLSSKANRTFYVPVTLHTLPKVKYVYQVISDAWSLLITMPELRYICLKKSRNCIDHHYNNCIQGIIRSSKKLETIVLCHWDERVARVVDRELRQFHEDRKVVILAGYNSRTQERKGPEGWNELNENWPWSLTKFTEFQTPAVAVYWKVEWNSKLWPYSLVDYPER